MTTVNPILAMKHLPDDELLTLVQSGDQNAFEELMRRNSSSSMKLALSILKDRQEAEDAVQESFFNVWRAIGGFQRESKLSTWISRIVTNQCLMRLRKTRRAEFIHIDDGAADGEIAQLQLPDPNPTPESGLAHRQTAELLQQEVAKLPPILRDVLVLRDLRQVPTSEVACRLGISLAAAKARLVRARTELRNRIQERQSRTMPALARQGI